MTYKQAEKLSAGDVVIHKQNGKRITVNRISKGYSTIFIYGTFQSGPNNKGTWGHTEVRVDSQT